MYIKDTNISPLYNGEGNAYVYKGHKNLAVVQRRNECFGIKGHKNLAVVQRRGKCLSI